MDRRDCVWQCRSIGEGGQCSTGFVQSFTDKEDGGLVSIHITALIHKNTLFNVNPFAVTTSNYRRHQIKIDTFT